MDGWWPLFEACSTRVWGNFRARRQGRSQCMKCSSLYSGAAITTAAYSENRSASSSARKGSKLPIREAMRFTPASTSWSWVRRARRAAIRVAEQRGSMNWSNAGAAAGVMRTNSAAGSTADREQAVATKLWLSSTSYKTSRYLANPVTADQCRSGTQLWQLARALARVRRTRRGHAA